MIYSFYFNWWIDKYFVQKKILINFSKISIKDRLINYKHDYTLFIERSKSRMWNPFLNFKFEQTNHPCASIAHLLFEDRDTIRKQTSKRQGWIFQCYSSISLRLSSHLCIVDDRSWLWLSSVKSTFASWSAVGT